SDDAAGAQLWESNCDLSHYSAILYRGNLIAKAEGPVYYRNCTGPTETVADLNALGSGKALDNVAGVSDFASFIVAPRMVVEGMPAVVSWCAPARRGLTIDGGVGPLPTTCGTIDVAPTATTTYTLSSNGVPAASAALDVACSGPGTPLAMSPADGASVPLGSVRLVWAPATGASSYAVYLDTNSPPMTRVAGGVLAISVDGQDVPTVGRHYWQVVAKASGCPAPTASPISTLDVSCTGAPLPSRPADGAAVPGGSITFEWAPAAGAS